MQSLSWYNTAGQILAQTGKSRATVQVAHGLAHT
jgi:hypothetical protein